VNLEDLMTMEPMTVEAAIQPQALPRSAAGDSRTSADNLAHERLA
jgi:hypothetical protein